MDVLEKPVVVVSKCLEFAECRWNGAMISSVEVVRLKPLVNFIPVCPELGIGLDVPRLPIRVICQEGDKRLVQPDTNRDLTMLMNQFLDSFLDSLEVVDGFILKEKSPSCGTGKVKIYPGPGKVPAAARGSGFFGGAVRERFPLLPSIDEDRLANLETRDYFLTRLFAIYRFRKLSNSPSYHQLVQFQAQNKLLFLAYNQKEMRIMGRIAANAQKKPLPEVLAEYEKRFYQVFARMPRFTSHINVLQHALGYLSKKITAGERRFFLGLLEQYLKGQQPLSVLLGVMRSWIIGFDVAYLRQQTYFNPFPAELMNLAGSG